MSGSENIGKTEEGESYEVTFTDMTLGISIEEGTLNSAARPVVKSISPNMAAYTAGVKEGDVITHLEGNEISKFEDFQPFLSAIGRPVRITFFRKSKIAVNNTPSDSVPKFGVVSDVYKSISSSFGVSTSGNENQSGNKSISSKASNKASQEANLSEEEKQARRATLSKAANDRTWEKQNQAKRAAKKQQDPANSAKSAPSTEETVLSEETVKVIQLTKEKEAALEKEMGYSPFRPVMSFSGNSAAVMSSSLPTAATHASGIPSNGKQIEKGKEKGEENVLDVEQSIELIAAVDDALAKLLSLGEPDRESARIALQTVLKMLTNLYTNQENVKFRSIRMSNDAFQKKIAVVPGGVDLLLAAGYKNSNSVAAASSQANEGSSNSYLVHDLGEDGVSSLRYTMARISEVLESELSSSKVNHS